MLDAGGSGRKMWGLGQKHRFTGHSRCQSERVPVTSPSHFIRIKPVAQEHGWGLAWTMWTPALPGTPPSQILPAAQNLLDFGSPVGRPRLCNPVECFLVSFCFVLS